MAARETNRDMLIRHDERLNGIDRALVDIRDHLKKLNGWRLRVMVALIIAGAGGSSAAVNKVLSLFGAS